ncbi:MAG: putative toxin-antitoxin system toxin component, PIN family [Coriobacteriales bacterium]|nr:putative toxin-antitoxin system toxin component, PIN family [Coriobacteriales bacterium]
MLDVVIDTNVLVAALIRPDGPNAKVLERLFSSPNAFRICYSSAMMAEYEDVLTRPFMTMRGLGKEAGLLTELIEEVGDQIVPKPVYAAVYPDRDDRPFLEATVYTNGALITNNTKDSPFAGVTILTPQEFLTWLKGRADS